MNTSSAMLTVNSSAYGQYRPLLVVKFRIHVFGFYPSVFFVGLNMNYRVTNNSATPLKISSVYSFTRLTKDLRIRAMCFYTSRTMLARLLENALYFSINVFSARVYRTGHFLHFPVFFKIPSIVPAPGIVPCGTMQSPSALYSSTPLT